MKDNIFIGQEDFNLDRKPKIGVLLTNLGTPDAPTKKALKVYLREFLSDPRVIELPKWKWQPILKGIILNTRPKKVAEAYESIWTDEGSPLLVITNNQAKLLKENLDDIEVAVGMRYGNPSIASGLRELRDAGVEKILLLPMYGQYASATAGSTFDAVADELKTWRWVPDLRTVMQFHDEDFYINSLAENVKKHWKKNGKAEVFLMSFHGIPRRYFLGGDPYFCHCQKTARLLAEKLGITDYVVSFQSLFGKEEWIKPYTEQALKSLAKSGVKSVDVICPGFLADCLETIEEIEEENKEYFLEAGGEKFSYIPALNDDKYFILGLSHFVKEQLKGWEFKQRKSQEYCEHARFKQGGDIVDLV